MVHDVNNPQCWIRIHIGECMVSIINLLNNMGPHNIIVGCREFCLNSSHPVQLLKHLVVIY